MTVTDVMTEEKNSVEKEEKSDITWTPEQEDAMSASGSNVLVCAAAGSGKTATLTERIIRRLTDPVSPADISRMVIVTYTNNAAAELKEKIYKAISKRIEQEPENVLLPIQLMKLPSARISTIHSFCLDIIKRNLSRLGLPSTVKTMDEGERAIRSRRIMEQIITDCYERESKDGRYHFSELAESLTTVKGEGTLADLFLELHRQLCSYPGGAMTLGAAAAEYESVCKNEFFESKYGRVYKHHTETKARAFIERFNKKRKELALEEEVHCYFGVIDSFIDHLNGMIASLGGGYASAREYVYGIELANFSGKRPLNNTPTCAYTRSLRAELKDWIDGLKRMYAYTPEQLEWAAEKTKELVRILSDILCRYEDDFREDKREAGFLDFGDFEYYALKLLLCNGEKTDVAREIEAVTDEIYIDEYQDVNEVQDSIFRAISNGKNLFMVGDVKQSIYTFRGGDPSIIIKRRAAYPSYRGDGDKKDGCTVFMKNNFRCDNTVVEYVNDIFDVLLGRANGHFEYKSEDKLVYSKDKGVIHENEVYPRFVLCDKADDVSDPGFDPEASFVAEEIVRLIRDEKKKDGKRIEPRDIAILLRYDKSGAPKYKRALEQRGVPVVSPNKQSPFDTPELQLVLCMLNVIDNPHRDIYLAGILMSELYCVSVGELVEIKREVHGAISLYDALCRYTNAHAWEKGRAFIARNDYYRELAKKTPVDRLIWQVYLDTGLLRCATEQYANAFARKKAKKNCMMIYELARKFEAGAFKGLYGFIEYLNGLISLGGVSEDKDEPSENAVRIMSMHGSKGLEFPVCFVSNTGATLENKDVRRRLLFEPEVGIGMMLRGGDGFTVCETPFRSAVKLIKNELFMEEEMRILYVALTRARERLYVTSKAPPKSSVGKLLENVDYKIETFGDDTVSGVSRFSEGLLISERISGTAVIHEHMTLSDLDPVTCLGALETEQTEEAVRTDTERTLYELGERFSYVYPHRALTRIKAKMSVSKLYPSVLDELEDNDLHARPQLDFSRKPSFASEAKAPSGAEKGTATHLIMQFADFERMEQTGAEAELARLVSEGYIDESSARIAKLEDIERFLESDFYKRIKNADRLWREFRFNLQLDADSFTEDPQLKAELKGEQLLVQGVIDGFFTEGEDVILFDYKTDYLTREELADPEKAAKKLSDRHAQQLTYYKMALERIFSRHIDQVYIYSLPLGAEVRVDVDGSAVTKTEVEI